MRAHTLRGMLASIHAGGGHYTEKKTYCNGFTLYSSCLLEGHKSSAHPWVSLKPLPVLSFSGKSGAGLSSAHIKTTAVFARGKSSPRVFTMSASI